MKKLINAPDAVVGEALAGMALAYPNLLRLADTQAYIARIDAPIRGKVAVVAGGGSGHEPLHSGFVGRGMLDAACVGQIFTAPTPDQIMAATQAVDGGAGVLYIVKNYAGDVMNFEIAAEMAHEAGIRTVTVIVGDDVASGDHPQGRRGTGVTVLVEKIAGAAAEQGAELDACAQIAQRVCAAGRTMGVALGPATVPAYGVPTFSLGDDEIELGIGIHGEPGRTRTRIRAADEVVALLADALFEDLQLRRGEAVLAFVNGMGGTPQLELLIVYRALAHYCAARGVRIERRLLGNYMTSLEMAGCSLSLLRLDDELTQLWDAPVLTPALRWGY